MSPDRSTIPRHVFFAQYRRTVWLLGLVVTMLTPTHGAAHKPVVSNPQPAQRREIRVPVADFRLEDQNGARFSFADLRGKAVIINFMYTSCPDVCPLLTASVKRVQDQLSVSEQQKVRFLSITTDPEIDTAKVLKGYAERHGVDSPNWSFLTGKLKTLIGVWGNFGVRVRKQAKGLIDHTTLTTIVDQEGQMRYAYFGSFPNPDTMLSDLRTLQESSE